MKIYLCHRLKYLMFIVHIGAEMGTRMRILKVAPMMTAPFEVEVAVEVEVELDGVECQRRSSMSSREEYVVSDAYLSLA